MESKCVGIYPTHMYAGQPVEVIDRFYKKLSDTRRQCYATIKTISGSTCQVPSNKLRRLSTRAMLPKPLSVEPASNDGTLQDIRQLVTAWQAGKKQLAERTLSKILVLLQRNVD